MARIFCIANQKGGVGKTTTTVNLAAGLVRIGQRVLVVDLDPQGNTTMGSGLDKRALEATVYDVLIGAAPAADAIQHVERVGYDVLGANRELAGAEVELVEIDQRDRRLKLALAEVQDDYDFILIDCPPSLSLLTLNGLTCAHGVTKELIRENLAAVGLEGHCDKPVSQLSGGMRRRVAIVRAVMSGAETVYFDEPFTGIDDATKKLAIEYILNNCEGRTLVFVSHCPDDAKLLNAKELRI